MSQLMKAAKAPRRKAWKRARSEGARDERRADILRAAEQLLDPAKADLPSVAEIARASRLAKGTPYLYFRTKEQIYLTVLAEGFMRWLSSIKKSLEAEPPSLDHFIKAYCKFCVDNPRLLYLVVRSSVILEGNINDRTARQFKGALAVEVKAIGRLIAERFPQYGADRAAKLFLVSYATTVGLWQYANPPPVIARVLKDASLTILRLDFPSVLNTALTRLWLA